MEDQKNENRCKCCWAYLEPNAIFCAKCGTPVGKGSFKPADNEIQCIYGPPPENLSPEKKPGKTKKGISHIVGSFFKR